MPKGSPQLVQSRREEIINACEKLYQSMSFKEITIREIGNATSFTRTSIYNYFQNKEEIFLALLQREYERWIASLKRSMKDKETMTVEEYAHMLSATLSERQQLLKILSMNHYDMETGCRPENLTAFKKVYGEALRTVEESLEKYFPSMTASRRQAFLYAFFPFMFGIYPYTFVTDKQKTAMEEAGVPLVSMTVYEITSACVKQLLKD